MYESKFFHKISTMVDKNETSQPELKVVKAPDGRKFLKLSQAN